MKNAKNKTSKNDASPVELAIEKLMRVADVAREMNINEKRARSHLRRTENVAVYDTFRNKSFAKNSTPYKKCVEILTAYKQRTAPITK